MDLASGKLIFPLYEIGLIPTTHSGPFKTHEYSLFYQDLFQSHPKDSGFKRLSNGALALDNNDYKISAAHKDNVLCLLRSKSTSITNLGCDLENLTLKNTDWSVFQGRFFSARDLAAISFYKNTQKKKLEESYLLFFSLKEAILKCTGLKIDPLDFAIGFEDKLQKFFVHSSSKKNDLSALQIQAHFFNDWIITVAYKTELPRAL